MARRSRRRFLAVAAAGVVAAASHAARAQPAVQLQPPGPLIESVTGGAPVRAGRVTLEIPRLADNGHAVPLGISVSSAMTESDHVRTIHILAERNPRPLVAVFHLNAHSARAEVSTRVRLNGSQRVLVIAGLSDGSFWSGTAEVEVTESACLDAT